MKQRTRRLPRIVRRLAQVAAGLCVATGSVDAANLSAPPASPESVAREALLDALAPALAVRGATAVFTVSPPDARRALEPCNAMTAFLPPGARLAGKTTVGVRCVDGATWQVFLSASVRVDGPVWQATRALRAGEPIAAGDVVQAVAPLTASDLDAAAALARSGPATNRQPATARGLVSIDGREPAPTGRIAVRAVATGRALTAADVRDESRISPGDPVRVLVVGDGFSITSEGRAVGSGDAGNNVMIRLASGSLVSGTVRGDHVVELAR